MIKSNLELEFTAWLSARSNWWARPVWTEFENSPVFLTEIIRRSNIMAVSYTMFLKLITIQMKTKYTTTLGFMQKNKIVPYMGKIREF